MSDIADNSDLHCAFGDFHLQLGPLDVAAFSSAQCYHVHGGLLFFRYSSLIVLLYADCLVLARLFSFRMFGNCTCTTCTQPQSLAPYSLALEKTELKRGYQRL